MCGQQIAEPEILLIPAGYMGNINIFHNVRNGEPLKRESRARVYEISKGGILRSQSQTNPGWGTPPQLPSIQPCAGAGDVTPALVSAIAKGRVHSGGGCIRSQLIVDGTLKLGAGVYQIVKPMLTKSGSSILGAGVDTVILESTVQGQFTVIGAHNSTLRNGDTDSGITLKDFRIVGANPKFHSAPQAVSLGNCVKCTVDNLWIDGTRSIGIQLGGSAQFGRYAKDSKIVNCLLTRVASQAIALVNGENIEISGNQILRPGQRGGPGASSIDLEVNGREDRLLNVKIVNNIIDHRNSEMPVTGNGIIVNGGSAGQTSNVLVDSNTIIGGQIGAALCRNCLSNGIMVFGANMRDVRVTHNKITRTGQTGIWLSGSNLICEDNTLDSVGGGGTEGFRATVNNTIIRRNSLVCRAGPCDSRMVVSGKGNTIEDNPGFVVK